jgi:hypothetical protein
VNEKQAIEAGTADGFLHLYNSMKGTSFRIVRYGDSPDVECADRDGRRLNLEITLTEDRPRDIQALLGRSEHRSLDDLRKHLEDVRAGMADPLERVSSLNGNVACSLAVRLRSKFKMRYGPHTALVIRDSSGVDWDWDLEIPEIRRQLASEANPFDEGVWILNRTKDRLFQLC